jgi:hypothetical protein
MASNIYCKDNKKNTSRYRALRLIRKGNIPPYDFDWALKSYQSILRVRYMIVERMSNNPMLPSSRA